MEGETKGTGWKIWIYLTPVYIILAIPLLMWIKKINSPEVGLSQDEYSAFNASEGEIKKSRVPDGYDPGLADSGYSVRYRSGQAEAGALSGDGPSREAEERVRRQAEEREKPAAGAGSGGGGYEAKLNAQAALESNETRNKEQMYFGFQKGYLTTAMGKVINNPKAVGAMLNNKYIVNGFMSRGTVKAATASPEALANYLKGPGPANFINNPVVKAALNNPAVVSAVASSGIVGAMLNTPAAQALMKDPQALGDLVNNNPQLMQMAMQNPQILTTLMSNPDVSGVVGKFDTSKVRKF